MGKSYPDRTNATGVWKISNIYRSRTTDGTYPDHSKSRMLVHGGSTPTKQNTIDFVEIPTTGNATDFGDLTSTRTEGGSGANVSRAVFMGGGEENTIDYVHFSSQGNAADFGDKTVSLVVSKIGSGRAILFSNNPNFRGSWYGTNRLFLNAILLGDKIRVP